MRIFENWVPIDVLAKKNMVWECFIWTKEKFWADSVLKEEMNAKSISTFIFSEFGHIL